MSLSRKLCRLDEEHSRQGGSQATKGDLPLIGAVAIWRDRSRRGAVVGPSGRVRVYGRAGLRSSCLSGQGTAGVGRSARSSSSCGLG